MMVQKKVFGFPKFGPELPPKPGPRSAVGRCFSAAGLGGLIPLVTLVSLVIGCSGSESASGPAAANGRPRVVTTTTIVADLVRQVGGDRVVVECLLGAGIDPHSYKATPRDADRLLRADLVVSSGLHLEGRLADLLARLADRVPVLAVADRLPPRLLICHDADDPEVPFADAGRLAAVRPDAELLRTERLGHLRILFARPVLAAVARLVRAGREPV